MNKFSGAILCVIFILFLTQLLPSCANIVPPTGGPRDTIPPKLVQAIPPDQSTNIKGKLFVFEFDERIILENLKQKLIITPRIEGTYEFKMSKYGFRLIFEEDFEDEVTYTFNFRDAIKDITEKNPTRDNTYTFSTGDYLDSLSIEGFITNLMKGDSIKEATVGLYKVDDTVNIFNGPPYYFTETEENGYYKISNIKNGIYKLYAFKDENNNLTLQTNNERFGFLPDTFNLQENLENKDIGLIKADLRKFNINNALAAGAHFEINFNKYLSEYIVDTEEYNAILFYQRAKENKSIRVYNTFPPMDSLKIGVIAVDSLGDKIDTTLYMKFRESRRAPEEFKANILPVAKSPIQNEFTGTITFSKPVSVFNLDSVFIRYDTTVIATFNTDTSLIWNKNRTEAKLYTPVSKALADSVEARKERRKIEEEELKKIQKDSIDAIEPTETQVEEGPQRIVRRSASEVKNIAPKLNKGLQLYVGKGSFIGVENDSLPEMSLAYEFLNPENFGVIAGNVSTNFNSYFIQLVDEKFNVIKEQTNVKQFRFDNVPAGKYRIRVLIDNNENGIWEFGDMRNNIPPEEVYVYKETISVRANWDQGGIDLTF